MATLSGKTTSGEKAWVKYIEKNPKWKDLTLVIENKMKDVIMLDLKGEKILFNNLKEKESLRLLSNKTKKIGRIEYAEVLYKNKKGLVPIAKIRKPTSTDVLKEEAIALNHLDSMIKDIVSKIGPFRLRIKGDPKKRIYENIIGARNVTEKVNGREAKSDFNIVSTRGDAIYISHKKAGGAKAFQQYGGVSKQAGSIIMNHPEVQSFLRKVAQNIVNGKLQNPMYSVVKDPFLIGLSVFGTEYGGPYSIENVTILGQGSAIITPVKGQDDLFELDFSDHLVHNGDIKPFLSGDYKAILGATFRAGRGFDVDGKRFTGARVGIYPILMIKNRSGAEEV